MLRFFCLCSLMLFLPPALKAQSVAPRPAAAPPELRFQVRLPEISELSYSAPTIDIPHVNLARLEVLIPKPLSDQMEYNGIYLRLNGEAANRIAVKLNVPEGKLVRLDLKRLPGFSLRPGKNSVEVTAELKSGTEVYAARVIVAPYLNGPTQSIVDTRPEKFTGEKYALIIGVSRYRFIPSLRFADADARAFRDFLLSPTGGNFNAQNIIFLENEGASLEAVQKALDILVVKVRPEDLLMFYLAGHGGPADPLNPKPPYYFMMADSDARLLQDTALPMALLRERLTQDLKAKRMISFIDTCFSAGIGGETGAENSLGMRSYGLNLANQAVENNLFTGEGYAVLTAADINERSYEKDGNGFFTYFLLRGLKGEADVNQDGYVTAGEIFEFTRVEVPKAIDTYNALQTTAGKAVTPTGQHPRAALTTAAGVPLATVARAPKTP